MFFGITFLKKIVEKSNRFFKIYKYLFYLFSCIVIMALPLGMIMLWKPYIMHCETKLDRTNAVPEWCLDEFPNVYHYIERIYWYIIEVLQHYRDNELFGFMNRNLDHLLTSAPMNILALYTFYKFLKTQSKFNN